MNWTDEANSFHSGNSIPSKSSTVALMRTFVSYAEFQGKTFHRRGIVSTDLLMLRQTRWRREIIVSTDLLMLRQTRWRREIIVSTDLLMLRQTRWRREIIVSTDLLMLRQTRWRREITNAQHFLLLHIEIIKFVWELKLIANLRTNIRLNLLNKLLCEEKYQLIFK